MGFLPLKIDGHKVYAGFWSRFGALFVDMLVLLPIGFMFIWMGGVSMPMAVAALLLSNTLFVGYTIYFHYRFGATIGKMAMDIKVAMPDGSSIGLRQALLRSSVDIPLAVLITIAQLVALSRVNAVEYLSVDWYGRDEFINSSLPVWYDIVDGFMVLWTWSELLVLLLNKRKRALHDFIAGTVVIHKKYATTFTQQKFVSEMETR